MKTKEITISYGEKRVNNFNSKDHHMSKVVILENEMDLKNENIIVQNLSAEVKKKVQDSFEQNV